LIGEKKKNTALRFSSCTSLAHVRKGKKRVWDTAETERGDGEKVREKVKRLPNHRQDPTCDQSAPKGQEEGAQNGAGEAWQGSGLVERSLEEKKA